MKKNSEYNTEHKVLKYKNCKDILTPQKNYDDSNLINNRLKYILSDDSKDKRQRSDLVRISLVNNKNVSQIYANSKKVAQNILGKKEDLNAVPTQPSPNAPYISYSYKEFPNLEHRQKMEDFHIIKHSFNADGSQSLFGIFDGHSGTEVGMYLKLNFSKKFHSILSQNKNNSIEEIMRLTFKSIDNDIINNNKIKNAVGATGTVIFLYKNIDKNTGKNERYLCCANVGDSKSFLVSSSNILQITTDHKCSSPSEVERIKKRGGIVFGGRVFGSLMLTRSFGDKEMKDYGVIAEPSVFVRAVKEGDLFCVVASDGAWDVVNEEEIMQLGQERPSSEEFATKIIELAKERETNDNVSCIVIKLNK